MASLSPIAVSNIFTSVTAIVSILASFSVVLTGWTFPSMLKSSLFRTILTISSCDFAGSLLIPPGYISQPGVLCAAQGFVSHFFYRASWFFTVAFSYQLYSIIINGRTRLKENHIHIVSWSLTTFCALIPFASGVTYGNDDQGYGTSLCGLESTNGTLEYAYEIAFYVVPQIASICILVIIAFSIVVKLFRHPLGSQSPITAAVNMLLIYPTCMIVSWLPAIINFFVINGTDTDDTGNNTYYAMIFTQSFGSLYGAFLATAFFANSQEARWRWWYFIVGVLGYDTSHVAPLESDVDTLSINMAPITVGDRSTFSLGSGSVVSIDNIGNSGLKPSNISAGDKFGADDFDDPEYNSLHITLAPAANRNSEMSTSR